jgi:hypothetical protein
VVVDQPELFTMGEGVWILDEKAGGFYTTVGTLVRREGRTWLTSRRHGHDYRDEDGAEVYTLFPVVSAYDADQAALENLAIDGNAEENQVFISGCRGGGVFALRCRDLRLADLRVRNVFSEGIGFQTCQDVEVSGCLVEDCAGNGFHPGSGTRRFHLHDCTARRNGASGLFYCLRVTDSLLEDCTFEENAEHGVSTGGRDVRNLNRRLTLRGNGGCGFFFRHREEANAAHDNVIEDCRLEKNCAKDGQAEVFIQGATRGVVLRGTSILRSGEKPAVHIASEVIGVEMVGNTIEPAGDGALRDLRLA